MSSLTAAAIATATATAVSTATDKLTWFISGGVTNLGECRQAAKSQQDGQAKKDDGIQADPNSVHDGMM
jgi:hypothetical protein